MPAYSFEVLTYQKGNPGVRFLFEKTEGEPPHRNTFQFSDHRRRLEWPTTITSTGAMIAPRLLEEVTTGRPLLSICLERRGDCCQEIDRALTRRSSSHAPGHSTAGRFLDSATGIEALPCLPKRSLQPACQSLPFRLLWAKASRPSSTASARNQAVVRIQPTGF